MLEDTHAYLKTGTCPKSLLMKKLFHIKDLFRDVLSSDPENMQHRESLVPEHCDKKREEYR